MKGDDTYKHRLPTRRRRASIRATKPHQKIQSGIPSKYIVGQSGVAYMKITFEARQATQRQVLRYREKFLIFLTLGSVCRLLSNNMQGQLMWIWFGSGNLQSSNLLILYQKERCSSYAMISWWDQLVGNLFLWKPVLQLSLWSVQLLATPLQSSHCRHTDTAICQEF